MLRPRINGKNIGSKDRRFIAAGDIRAAGNYSVHMHTVQENMNNSLNIPTMWIKKTKETLALVTMP
jgi:hypothetical protein